MRYWRMTACLIGMVLIVTGCNLPAQATPTVGGVDYIRTSAAKTLDAFSTTMVSPRGTPGAEATLSSKITPTLLGVTTPLVVTPSSTSRATSGTPTNTLPCDQVTFVRDITIPDGTLLQPGSSFSKTWELKNSGSCAWNSTYSLVFANEGDVMGGVISKPLIISGAVAPGELVKVSVDLRAQAAAGDYKSHWRLRNPLGVDFAPAGKTFWVAIKVKAPNQAFLLDNMCFAMWRNGSGDLGCPGKPGDAKGSISLVASPKFSTGYQDDEPAFQMEPQQVNDGMIVGEFPPYLVNSSQPVLRTIIACAFDAKACDTKVTITGQVSGEPEQILGEWNVAYKSDWIVPKLDFAAKGLVGKSVVLQFFVRANGPATQDRVLFLSPHFSAP